MQTQGQHTMCYRRGNRNPRRKTSPPPSKRSIIYQKMQLGYMNSNRPFKPNLPDVPKLSKLLTPMRLRRTFFFSNLPDSAIIHSIRHPWHLPILSKAPKTLNTQHSKWVWVMFGQKSPLNRYDNERGNKKRLQRFLSKNEQLFLIGWVF